jgi:hypothetical protein
MAETTAAATATSTSSLVTINNNGSSSEGFSSEGPIPEVWDREQLMGDSNKKNDPMLWGVPGHLTSEQVDIFMKLKAELNQRGPEFRDTLFCFGIEEGEAFAICRWLRARKYVYADVIAMIEEATKVRAVAKEHGFYPDPVAALGCDPSLFYAQYPQLYSGFAKNGVPLFISKPGILNVDGMECITTLDGILKFHWYIMMHDFANRLRAQKQKDPDNFKRYVLLGTKQNKGVPSSSVSPLTFRFLLLLYLALNVSSYWT